MLKIKYIIVLVLCAVLTLTGTVNVYSADVGNNTSEGEANVPGRASPGSAAWSNRQASTMWKVTVYAAKNECSTFDEQDISVTVNNPLSGRSLTDDFYKFGESFWLYEGTDYSGNDYSIYTLKKNDFAGQFWFATSSKEEYRNDFESRVHPGGSIRFSLTSSDALEHRLFDVREMLRIEGVYDNGYPPKDGKRIILPYVKNVNANKAYNDSSVYDDAVTFFFCNSKRNWNCFLDCAAISAGFVDYSRLLYSMIEEGMFKYKNQTVTSFEMIDPARKQSSSIPGRWEPETSQVAWAIAFEPVIVFYKHLDNGYNYYAMTASDAAAAMVSGCIAFTMPKAAAGYYTVVSGAQRASSVPPSSILDELCSWDFVSPFFINLGRSVIPEYPWFGYRALEPSDYYDRNSSILYYDALLLNGGIGFRYQAGGKVPVTVDGNTSLVLEKKLSDNKTNPDFTGVVFGINNGLTQSSFDYLADLSVVNDLELTTPVHEGGKYTELITLGNKTGEAVYEKVLKASEVFARCTVRFDSEVNTSIFINEVSTGIDYDRVRVVPPNGGILYQNWCLVNCAKGNTYRVMFENLMSGPLIVSKRIKDNNGDPVSDYSGIVFLISGRDPENINFGNVYVRSDGRIIGYAGCDSSADHNLYDTNGTPVKATGYVPGLSVTVKTGDFLQLTVYGIPDGNWKVTELFATEEAAKKCYKTMSGSGREPFTDVSVGTSVLVSKNPEKVGGKPVYDSVSFENTVSTSLFDLELLPVSPDDYYTVGTYVITSYILVNHGSRDVMTADGLEVSFFVYYYKNGDQVVIEEAVKKGVVVPSGESNLVWFMWKIPEFFKSDTLYCAAEVNPTKEFIETDYKNNGALVTNFSIVNESSDTPDTVYERERPSWFTDTPKVPPPFSDEAVFQVWEEKDGMLVRNTYSVSSASLNIPSLSPENFPYTPITGSMRSGRGFYLSSVHDAIVLEQPDSFTCPKDSYTGIQTCTLYLPEFNYSTDKDCYITLMCFNEIYQGSHYSTFALNENPGSDDSERIHFIPVWYPDGVYSAVLICDDYWTPAGKLTFRQVIRIEISGDAYDDWYTRR